MYSIAEWRDRYEVSDKGHPARGDEPLRRGKLDYIRAPVVGKSWTLAYREFNRVFGNDAPAAYGVFCKMRELQADNERDFRDCIRDHKGNPMTAETIAGVLGWPEKQVVKIINLLTSPEIGWVADHTQHNSTQHNTSIPAVPKSAGNSRELPENPGKDDSDPDFIAFWSAYPRKEARAVALKAWQKAKPSLPAVMSALEWQRAFWTDPKFIPMPATYLNQRRWEDERKIDAAPTDPTGTSAFQRYQEQFKRGEF